MSGVYLAKGRAADLNGALQALPKAQVTKLRSVFGEEDSLSEPVPNFNAIRVTDSKGRVSYVNCPTPKYRLVQHWDAFRPMIDAMVQAGVQEFDWTLKQCPQWADLNIFVHGSGHDSVELGFRMSNSFDGNSGLIYGVNMNKSKRYVEVVGYREVCKNGMVAQVPLDAAEFVRPEIRKQVEGLLSSMTNIPHLSRAEDKIQRVKWTIEAVALLREPVEAMIKAGQDFKIADPKVLERLVKAHVGSRFKKRVLEQYEKEASDLWGLFNAMTHVASHDPEIKVASRETLMQKAAQMLRVEVTA
jgi:hypothetical protein